MNAQFLKALAAYAEALDTACESLDESNHMTPHLNRVPVFLDTELVGWLVDDVGCSFQYQSITEKERAWWEQRPWLPQKGTI